jgi:folate-binding protein YgfZ
MTDNWQSFVAAQEFSSRSTAVPSSRLVDLTSLGIVLVSGKDSETFLQGQFTNDVSLSTPRQAQLSAWCSPKGRVLLSFWLCRCDAGFRLLMPTVPDAKLLARLRMFVLRANVKVALADESIVRIGCSGRDAELRLRELYSATPEHSGEVLHSTSGISMLRSLGEQPRFELVGPTESVKHAWRSLGEVCDVVQPNIWTREDLETGLPLIDVQTSDQYLPQMLNLLELGAINFDKGCYVGQEIIARLHYRGNVKRRLYVATCETLSPVVAGDEVLAASGGMKRASGKVLASQRLSGEGLVVQTVLNVADTQEATTFELVDGTKLTLREPIHATESA